MRRSRMAGAAVVVALLLFGAASAALADDQPGPPAPSIGYGGPGTPVSTPSAPVGCPYPPAPCQYPPLPSPPPPPPPSPPDQAVEQPQPTPPSTAAPVAAGPDLTALRLKRIEWQETDPGICWCGIGTSSGPAHPERAAAIPFSLLLYGTIQAQENGQTATARNRVVLIRTRQQAVKWAYKIGGWPPVDFSKEAVVGVFYSEDSIHTTSLTITSLVANGSTLRIALTRYVAPFICGYVCPAYAGGCGPACPRTTQYVLVTLPKAAVRNITRLVVDEADVTQ